MEEQPQQQSEKRCVVEITELEFIRINEWLKHMIGTKTMSKLSKEMLSMRIDKNIKSASACGSSESALLIEFVEHLEQIQAMVAEKDKQIETLAVQLKKKADESDKMKNQLTTVLLQFKTEREKHAAKIAEMSQLLKERENCISESQKTNAAAEHTRKTKIEETFSKLFEKNSEISLLKEQLETVKAELDQTKLTLQKSDTQLRNALSVEGFQKPRMIPSTDEIQAIKIDRIQSELPVKESAVSKTESPEFSVSTSETMLKFYSIVGLKKARSAILHYLGIEESIRLKTSSMYLYRVISCDFALLRVVASGLLMEFKRKTRMIEKSLEGFKESTNSFGDSYINFIFYKHMYLRHAFGENFNKAIVRCGSLLQRLASNTLDSPENLTNRAAPKENEENPLQQQRPRPPVKKEPSTGIFKSIMDKVDEYAISKIPDLSSKPKHSSRTYSELEALYLEHAELFKRVGLMFSDNDDYEMQLSHRDQQIATLNKRIVESSQYISAVLRNNNIFLEDLGVEPEDVRSVVELVMFSSLHYQETKELKALVDVLAKLFIQQIKDNVSLDTLIQDLEMKAAGDTRVKKFFSDKAQICETKATAAELKLLEKEEKLHDAETEAVELKKKIRDLVQSESKLKYANTEYKNRITEQDQKLSKLGSEKKSLLDTVMRNFELVTSAGL